MAAPAKKIFTVGLNAVRIYELDQDTGWINGSTGATAYAGLSPAPVSFEYNFPDPETIQHPGNNQILQQDALPSLDSSSGTLMVSRTDYDTIVALNNTNVRVFGDINSVGWRTNQQGTEPTVALVAYAQGKLASGVRGWSTYVFPKAVIIPKPKGMSREQQNMSFFVQPQFSTSHLIGESYAIGTDGFTSAEMNEYQSNYRLHFEQWVTTSTASVYTFNSNHPYTNNGSGGIQVTKNGVLMTYGATADATHYQASATAVTFGASLVNGDVVVAMYELAETAVDVE